MPRFRWTWKAALFVFLSLAIICLADDDDDGFDQNPILTKQPPFACSLPVQILLNGIVLALTSVLLFHLLFTAQYHYPLAPLNYSLQLSGVLSLLVTVVATLYVVLNSSLKDSREWPYMLTYLAKDVPPSARNSTTTSSDDGTTVSVYDPTPWSTAELAAWYAMAATTSGLVQITHIQFLTLLYPSYLERKLILGLLGPLALLSASMELLPIHQSQKVIDIASTIRNTCNAALSLLFTSALFLYGFVINSPCRRRKPRSKPSSQKQLSSSPQHQQKHQQDPTSSWRFEFESTDSGAWRTDGGTAVFGISALSLALISTFLNFLYIPTKDQYLWLPALIWAVVLWQSFLGWWWWVGGGRGYDFDGDGGMLGMDKEEVEELLKREERRMRKREKRLRERRERREKAKVAWKNASENLNLTMHFGKKGGAGGVGAGMREGEEEGGNVETPGTRPPHDGSSANTNSLETPNGNSLTPPSSSTTPPSSLTPNSTTLASSTSPSSTSSSSTLSTSSAGSGILAQIRTSRPYLALSHFYHLLRRAHLAAAHSQALERMRRRRQVYGRELGLSDAVLGDGTRISAGFNGTGVDSSGINGGLIGNGLATGVSGTTVAASTVSTSVLGWGLGSFGLRRDRRERERRNLVVAAAETRFDRMGRTETMSTSISTVSGLSGTSGVSGIGSEGHGLDEVTRTKVQQEQQRERDRTVLSPPEPMTGSQWSLWWFGPLRRWRLQDSSVYS